MDEISRKAISDYLDELSSLSITLDISFPDELESFIKKLKQFKEALNKYSFAPASEALGVFLEAFSSISANNYANFSGSLSHLLGSLQYILGENKTGPEQKECLMQFKSYIANVLALKSPGGNIVGLSATQKEEIPDFISHALGVIEGIEKELLGLDKKRGDLSKIAPLLSNFHVLKGEASLLGITNISSLTHNIESLLEKIKKNESAIDEEVVSGIFNAADIIKEILRLLAEDLNKGLCYDIAGIQEKIARFLEKYTAVSKDEVVILEQSVQEAVNKVNIVDSNAFTPKIPQVDLSDGPALINEFISESKEHLASAEEALLALESSPSDIEAMNKIFREFHTIKGLASFLNLEDIKILAHDTETMLDLIRNTKLALTTLVTDIVLASIDGLTKLLTLLKAQVENNGVLNEPYHDVTSVIASIRGLIYGGNSPKEEPAHKKLGDILIEKGIISDLDLTNALDEQGNIKNNKKIGEILVENKAATDEQIKRGLVEQRKAVVSEETVKISLKKLDNLINNTGELVIIASQISQNPVVLSCQNSKLLRDIVQFNRIIRDIQNVAMSMRFVPIRPIFQRMARLVRDLSKKMAKEIDMNIYGEETEIDKNIIELISDPLVHMVRNAVDHGIEPAKIRLENGKPARGLIELSAYHKGGYIVIEIKDDGGGLDKDRILKKAIELALIAKEENPPDEKIFNMIFESGFSTADKVSDVSGRGVGMDVVKRNIDQLRGKIEIQSGHGRGTTFKIKIPLTLAIIDGVILSIGQERYIAPIFSIQEFIKPRLADISIVMNKGEMIKVHGEFYPLIRIGDFFNVGYKKTDIESMTACLVNSDYGSACILVDELLGLGQVVIKSLWHANKEIKSFAGATILSDGRVGLILDMNGLVSSLKEKSPQSINKDYAEQYK